MRIRAQIGMVLNLDKCIGCHTCSVTCRTSGPAAMASSTPGSTTWKPSPASAIPEWENQGKWKGGWNRTASGSWNRARRQAAHPGQSVRQANLPQIDDYYEPYTYDYEHLKNAPLSRRRRPRARCRC